MNYIILDLEYNQAYDVGEEATAVVAECPFEVIQIGAVKMDADLDILDYFNYLVKPSIYTAIHPYVEKITGLSASKFDDAPSFKTVYSQFIKFIGNEKSLMCIWGGSDINYLFKNIEYYKLKNNISHKYINVQQMAGLYLKQPPGKCIGLKNAVESMSLQSDIHFHNALNDAIYTAKIFKIVKNANIPSQVLRQKNPVAKPGIIAGLRARKPKGIPQLP